MVDVSSFTLNRLTRDYEILPFDCDDPDLNDFLFNDAKSYLDKFLAVTYLLQSDAETIAFFCVANDKIAMEDFDDEFVWKKRIKKKMPRTKQYSSYPAVKIGRLGITKSQKGNGLGRQLMDFIKNMFVENNKTGCMFITVDSYLSAVGYY